jgi:hypothetical protein
MMLRSFVLATFAVCTACSPAASQAPLPAASGGALTAASKTHAGSGAYTPVVLDSIERVSVDAGKLVLRGSSSSVAIDPPASADLSKPTRNWALTTESDLDGRRSLTFTHAQSVEEFTIELPPGQGNVLYGVFAAPADREVMVLAWGAESRSYWGYLTISRK